MTSEQLSRLVGLLDGLIVSEEMAFDADGNGPFPACRIRKGDLDNVRRELHQAWIDAVRLEVA